MVIGVLVEMFPVLQPSWGFRKARRSLTPHKIRNLFRKMTRTGEIDPQVENYRLDGSEMDDREQTAGPSRSYFLPFLTRVGSRRFQEETARRHSQQQQPQQPQQQQRSLPQTTANFRDDDDDDDRNNYNESDYGSDHIPAPQDNNYGAWTGASIVGMFYPSNYGLDLAPLSQQQQKQVQQRQQQPQQQGKGTRARSRKQVDDWLFGAEGPLPYRGEEN